MTAKTFKPHELVFALALLLPAAPALLPAPAAAGDTGSRPAAAADVAPSPPRRPEAPLILDTADLGVGASVVFTRIPSPAEIHDLEYLESVGHVVLQLPGWPAGIDELQPLAHVALPQGADFIVVLPGYPATNAQAAAWNMLRQPTRLVMVVNGPPADRDMVFRLNSIRPLVRVIADVDRPSRSGFERLQRPLSFRVRMP